MPRIHTHCFENPEEARNKILSRAEAALKCPIDHRSTIVHRVRNVSPKKEMFCISFTLPKEAAYARSRYVAAADESDDRPVKKAKFEEELS
jgi:tRNA (guanine37-N1)-methyltransferase